MCKNLTEQFTCKINQELKELILKYEKEDDVKVQCVRSGDI